MGSKAKTLNDLLVHQLRDLHSAERHCGKTLGKLARTAEAEDVKIALESLAHASHAQLDELDALFERLDRKTHAVPCEAMQGIIEEAKELLHDFEGSPALDAGLIASAQAMLHYGIARCSSIRAWSRQLGTEDIAAAVEPILAGKRQGLEALGQLAEAPRPDGADHQPPSLTLKTAALRGLA